MKGILKTGPALDWNQQINNTLLRESKTPMEGKKGLAGCVLRVLPWSQGQVTKRNVGALEAEAASCPDLSDSLRILTAGQPSGAVWSHSQSESRATSSSR